MCVTAHTARRDHVQHGDYLRVVASHKLFLSCNLTPEGRCRRQRSLRPTIWAARDVSTSTCAWRCRSAPSIVHLRDRLCEHAQRLNGPVSANANHNRMPAARLSIKCHGHPCARAHTSTQRITASVTAAATAASRGTAHRVSPSRSLRHVCAAALVAIAVSAPCPDVIAPGSAPCDLAGSRVYWVAGAGPATVDISIAGGAGRGGGVSAGGKGAAFTVTTTLPSNGTAAAMIISALGTMGSCPGDGGGATAVLSESGDVIAVAGGGGGGGMTGSTLPVGGDAGAPGAAGATGGSPIAGTTGGVGGTQDTPGGGGAGASPGGRALGSYGGRGAYDQLATCGSVLGGWAMGGPHGKACNNVRAGGGGGGWRGGGGGGYTYTTTCYGGGGGGGSSYVNLTLTAGWVGLAANSGAGYARLQAVSVGSPSPGATPSLAPTASPTPSPTPSNGPGRYTFVRRDRGSWTASIQLNDSMCVTPRVHLWGAGGGGAAYYSDGGAGAYVTGILHLPPNASLRVIVGMGGMLCGGAGDDNQGGGGAAPTPSPYTGASGGGRSAILLFNSSTMAWDEIVTAAGGGGASDLGDTSVFAASGGAGGISFGFAGLEKACLNNVSTGIGTDGFNGGGGGGQGSGGLTSCFCRVGGFKRGGNANTSTGAGGGGGWYGGGSSCCWLGGGGGGSSMVDNLVDEACSCSTGIGASAGGDRAPLYTTGIGTGGRGRALTGCLLSGGTEGGHGMVIIDCGAPAPPPELLRPVAALCDPCRAAGMRLRLTRVQCSKELLHECVDPVTWLQPTMLPSASSSPTAAASASPSPTASASPSPTASPTAASTSTFTPTESPTQSATASSTPSASLTSAPTSMATMSSTPPPTPATASPTAMQSGTATVAPTPSSSPPSSPSPSSMPAHINVTTSLCAWWGSASSPPRLPLPAGGRLLRMRACARLLPSATSGSSWYPVLPPLWAAASRNVSLPGSQRAWMTCLEPASTSSQQVILHVHPASSTRGWAQPCAAAGGHADCAPVGTTCVMACLAGDPPAAGEARPHDHTFMGSGTAAIMCDGDGEWRPATVAGVQPSSPLSFTPQLAPWMQSVLQRQHHIAPLISGRSATPTWQLDCDVAETWNQGIADAGGTGLTPVVSSDCAQGGNASCEVAFAGPVAAPVCLAAFPPPRPLLVTSSIQQSTGDVVVVDAAPSPPMPWAAAALSALSGQAWPRSPMSAWQDHLRRTVGAHPGGQHVLTLRLNATIPNYLPPSALADVNVTHCRNGTACEVVLAAARVMTIPDTTWTRNGISRLSMHLTNAVDELRASAMQRLQVFGNASVVRDLGPSMDIALVLTACGHPQWMGDPSRCGGGGNMSDAESAIPLFPRPGMAVSVVTTSRPWPAVLGELQLPRANVAPTAEMQAPAWCPSGLQPARLLLSNVLPAGEVGIRFPEPPAPGEVLSIACNAASDSSGSGITSNLAIDTALSARSIDETWFAAASPNGLVVTMAAAPRIGASHSHRRPSVMMGFVVCNVTSTAPPGSQSRYRPVTYLEIPYLVLAASLPVLEDVVTELRGGLLRSLHRAPIPVASVLPEALQGVGFASLPQLAAEPAIRAAAAPAAAGARPSLTLHTATNITLVASSTGAFPMSTDVRVGGVAATVLWRSTDGALIRVTTPPASALCDSAGWCRDAVITMSSNTSIMMSELVALVAAPSEASRRLEAALVTGSTALQPSISCPPFCPGWWPQAAADVSAPFPSMALTPTASSKGLWRSPLMLYTAECTASGQFVDPSLGFCTNASHPLAPQCPFGSGDSCRACMELSPGAVCPGGHRAWPRPGYWAADDGGGIVRCLPPAGRCLGWDSIVGASMCAPGYSEASVGCSRCASGWYVDRNDACSPCPNMGNKWDQVVYALPLLGSLLGVGLGMTVLALATRGLHGRSNKESAALAVKFITSTWAAVQVRCDRLPCCIKSLPASSDYHPFGRRLCRLEGHRHRGSRHRCAQCIERWTLSSWWV